MPPRRTYDWKSIKAEYEIGKSNAFIHEKYDVPYNTLSMKIKRDKWEDKTINTKYDKFGRKEINGKSSFLYVVKVENTNYYKVGMANDPLNRLITLQIGNPYRLELISAVYSEQAYEKEQAIHKRLDKYRIRGEWFELTDSQVRTILKHKK